MGLQRFPLSDFRGGLNTKDGPFGLESNEAQDLLNVTLTERGVLAQRAGKTQFDTSGFPAGKRAEHIRNWYFAATRLLMLSIDGTVYSSSSGGALTSRHAGTAGTVWCFEQATDAAQVDTLWMLNGVDAPTKWVGSGATAAWANTPPPGSMMRLWKNRMCIAGDPDHPQRLYYSEIGDPESPAAKYGDNWVDVKGTEDDLDPITWLEVLGDYLVIFKKQSLWVLPSVADPSQTRRVGSPGCEGRFMSTVLKGRVYFFHRSGVWSSNCIQAPRLESEKIENFITDSLNYSQIAKVRLAASRDRRLFVALPFTGADNDHLLEFVPDLVAAEGVTDPRAGAWSVHDYKVSSMCTFRPVAHDILMAGASDTNKLHILFNGTNDDGVAIAARWQSSWRSIISEEPFERVRRVNVELNGQCIVSIYKDFNTQAGFSGAIISDTSTGDDLWDGGVWDGGMWDPPGGLTALRRVRPETRARYHSVKLSNEVLDKTFTIYALELAVRGGKEHT